MNGRERLEVLAAHLEQLQPTAGRKFDLGTWLAANCNTSACAVGEAMELPALQAEGLGKREWYAQLDEETGMKVRNFEPMYKGLTAFDAVQAFFGIECESALHLFALRCYSYRNVTPQEVAERIRQFLNDTRLDEEDKPHHPASA